MIVDNFCNISNYLGINENLDSAIKFLGTQNIGKIPLGKVCVDGQKIYYNCEMMETRSEEEALYEVHRKYMDIHICLEGKERIKTALKGRLSCMGDYEEIKDIQWLAGECDNDVILRAGDVMICFPEDAHMPLLDNGERHSLKKMIVKVAV